MRVVLAALVALVAALGIAHAQTSIDQQQQKRAAKNDPHPHCQVDRGGYCWNNQVAMYRCITHEQCRDLERIDHAWSWRTDFRFLP